MFVEYPKALYKNGTFNYEDEIDTITVHNKQEEDAAADDGYYAFGTGPKEVQETNEVQFLRAQLTAKGVKVDNRWGLDRLKEEVSKAK